MPKINKTTLTCDWKAVPTVENKKTFLKNRSKLYKHKGDFKWQGIKIERYKATGDDWADIVRHILIGSHGEKTRFHLRYFEISPGGHSSFETHRHEHVVICVRGKGKVLMGEKTCEMNFLDTLYIAPNTPHQLRNPFKKTFGFFCIVNSKRDRPKILNPSSAV